MSGPERNSRGSGTFLGQRNFSVYGGRGRGFIAPFRDALWCGEVCLYSVPVLRCRPASRGRPPYNPSSWVVLPAAYLRVYISGGGIA